MDHLLLRHNLIQSYVRDISLNLSNLCTFGCFLVFFLQLVSFMYQMDHTYALRALVDFEAFLPIFLLSHLHNRKTFHILKSKEKIGSAKTVISDKC